MGTAVATLDTVIQRAMRAPKKESWQQTASRFEPQMPTDFLLDELGFNNYRQHTARANDELVKSIRERGLLEPITLAYDQTSNSWDLIDGEGRFFACLKLQATTIPVRIFYDLPKSDIQRMKLAANAAKAPIPAHELATFSNSLYTLLQEYFPKEAKQLETKMQELQEQGVRLNRLTLNEFAHLMGMHPARVSNHLTFAGLPEPIKEYVRDEERHFYNRAVKIGRRIKDPVEQMKFFRFVRKKEQGNGRLSSAEFTSYLKRTAQNLARSHIFSLELGNGNGNHGKASLKQLMDYLRSAVSYTEAFINYAQHDQGMLETAEGHTFPHKRTDLSTLLQDTSTELDRVAATYLTPDLIHRRDVLLNRDMNFKDKVLRKLKSRKNGTSDPKRITTLAEKISYIPVNQIRTTKRQPRQTIDQEELDLLAEEISQVGQIKPGLVRRTGTRKRDNAPLYTMVYGQRRLRAVRKAGIPYYTAFIENDLTPLEVGILQCMEDLSESDKPVQRAEGLWLHYLFLKEEHNGEYSPEQFKQEYGHLASKQTLDKVFQFKQSSALIQQLVKANLLGYDAGIKLSKLPDDCQSDILLALLSSDRSISVDERIRKAEEHKNQASLDLDVSHSCYDNMFRQFEQNLLAPLQQIALLQSNNGPIAAKVLNNPVVHAKLYQLYENIATIKGLL